MDDIRKIAGWINIIPEVRAEVAYLDHWGDVINESLLDTIDGPRYGPGPNELWDIEQADRIRTNLRSNLGAGHPAGRYRRH